MDAVLRALAIYFFLLILFRITGKRSVAQITVFDFVVILIVAEATQQAMLGDDFSVTNAFIVVGTLIAIDLGLSLIASRSDAVAKLTEGVPLVLVEDGKVHEDGCERAASASTTCSRPHAPLTGSSAWIKSSTQSSSAAAASR